MKTLFSFLLILLFLNNANKALCQKPADTTTKVITIGNSAIKDCIAAYTYIWILREDGCIIRINPKSMNIVDSLKFDKKIVAIGESNKGSIYVADGNGLVFGINYNNDTNLIWHTNQSIQSILFNSEGRCFLITDKGIYDPEMNAKFDPKDAFTNGSVAHFNLESWEPSAKSIDNNDDIWLGFSAGEWGGDIVIFSTDKMKFIKFEEKLKKFYYLEPVHSIFQIGTKIYATTSLQHMGILRSSIIEITDTCRYFFKSPLLKWNAISMDGAKNLFKKQEIYLGPSTYNPVDMCIYFYCQFGVFKGNIKKDLSKLENWQLVLKPKFMWYYGMPDAVGYGMNVSKMFFEGNKLFVLSPDNGILVWDGKESVLLKTTYKPPKW